MLISLGCAFSENPLDARLLHGSRALALKTDEFVGDVFRPPRILLELDVDFGVPFRRRLADADLRLKCAVQLLVPQLFALLQLVQLWCVLARLAEPPDDVDSSGFNVAASAEAAKSALTGRLVEAQRASRAVPKAALK